MRSRIAANGTHASCYRREELGTCWRKSEAEQPSLELGRFVTYQSFDYRILVEPLEAMVRPPMQVSRSRLGTVGRERPARRLLSATFGIISNTALGDVISLMLLTKHLVELLLCDQFARRPPKELKSQRRNE